MKTNDTHGTTGKGWIGVDLDGTLAVYHHWQGPDHIGAPIAPMVQRVRQWLNEGKRVKILTARVAPCKDDHEVCRRAIYQWIECVFGRWIAANEIEITHEKDHFMLELWDDRAVQVIPNTGRRADSLVQRCIHRFWLLLCYAGSHDWRDGLGSRCRTCGCMDKLM